MDYEVILSKVSENISKFIDAATPIAQRAYEIGLLTLRIDAIQAILFFAFLMGIFLFLNKKLSDHKKNCVSLFEKDAPNKRVLGFQRTGTWVDYSGFDDLGYLFSRLFVFVSLFLISIKLFNVWLWIKLINPELWLAKTAIEAVIDKITK